MRKNKECLLGGAILSLILLFALFTPFFSHYTYSETHLPLKNLPPSLSFFFGTDELGRDVFVRAAWGARISLFVGISAALIDLLIGVFWGVLAGLASPKKEEFFMRLCDILQGIPYLLMVILLIVMIGNGLFTIIIALTLTGWINMARIVRGEMLKLKEKPFILSAKAIGASKTRIVFSHLLPNALPPILTTMTLTIPTAMFTEAFLSFLGLGVQAPIASWGVMINDGLMALRYYPWRLFFPAILISLSILGFHLLGDGLKNE